MESNSQPFIDEDPFSTTVEPTDVQVIGEDGEDQISQARVWVNTAWEAVLSNLDWNETLQTCLAVFLVSLILLTCLYKRRKLAKSAMTTIHRYSDQIEAERQTRSYNSSQSAAAASSLSQSQPQLSLESHRAHSQQAMLSNCQRGFTGDDFENDLERSFLAGEPRQGTTRSYLSSANEQA